MSKQNNLTHLETLVVSIQKSFASSVNSNYLIPTNRFASTTISNEPKNSANNNAEKRKNSKQRWKSQHQVQINASERERKGRLAANIKKLKEIIPLEPIKLQTKEMILEETVKYICKLKEKVEEMMIKDAPQNLVTEMNELKKKVVELESERKIYQRVLQSHGLLNKLQTHHDDFCTKRIIPRYVKRSLNNENHGKNATASSTSATSSSPSSTLASTSSTTTVSSTLTASATSIMANIAAKKNLCESSSSVGTSLKPVSDTTHSLSTCFENSSNDSLSTCSACVNSVNFDTTHRLAPISLPNFDPLLCKPNIAFCRPTYSMARMKPAESTKTPTLFSMLTESVCDKNKINKTVHNKGNLIASKRLNSSQSPNLTNNQACKSSVLSLSSRQSSSLVSSAKNSSITSVSTSSDSLLSWLRSSDTSSVVPAAAPACNLPTNEEQSDLGKTSDSSKPITHDIPASSNTGKKETSSFNIASLMKSKATSSVPPSAPVSTGASNLQKHFSKDLLATTEQDFNATTPKDIFHQSFENDILDCLQNIHGLTTPEPVAKTAANVDWMYLGDSNNPRIIQAPYVHSYNASDEAATVSKDVNSSHANLAAPFVNPITTSSVLWQPAITYAARTAVSFPNAQTAFSISYSYLNNTNLQNSASESHPPAWVAAGEAVSFVQGSSRHADHVGALPESLMPSKKRKCNRPANKAKRKKSNTKSNVDQEDTHSISRLIGSQYSSAHQPILAHSQRYCNPGASYENDRNIADPSQLFTSSTPNAVNHPGMGYNNYTPQSNLFHSSPTMNHQAPSYHHPHGGYFYNHPVPPHPPQGAGSIYVPRFANVNNNNSGSPMARKLKPSQHHIRQILS